MDKFVLSLFNTSKDSTVKELSVPSKNIRQNHVLIENEKSGYFSEADYIAKYVDDQELVVLVIRVWRNDFNLFKWIKEISKLFRYKSMDGLYVATSFRNGYFDVVIYRERWVDWLISSV